MSTTAGTVGTALVTGATHGIGGAAALRPARDGWEVIVHVKSQPMGRRGDPRLDIAPAVLFLATDDARYITGQTVGVDGGSLLHA